MNELMLHVERIVRPVCATQSRKLRMRNELLTHLRATLEEERQDSPQDEPAAIERAKHRLGTPAELTRQLQQTVPRVERLLLAKLPISPGFDQWEQRAARRIHGNRGAMTLGHISILSGIAIFVTGPLFLSMISALKSAGMQTAHVNASFLGALIGSNALFFAASRFVFFATSPDRLNWPGTLNRGALIFTLQIAIAFFLVWSVANRCATTNELLACTAFTIVFLAVAVLVARGVSVLRAPYDQWLTLDIAE